MAPLQNDKAKSFEAWDPTEYYRDAFVAESYDDIRFSSLAGRGYVAIERHVLLKAFIGLRPNSTVLDAPCGTGRLAEVLLKAGHNVVGADISASMLSVAERRLSSFGDRFRTFIADAREITIEDFGRPFDAALCARVLMHFPLKEQVEFLTALSRVTNGPIVFTQSFDSGYQRMRRTIKRALRHQTPVQYPLSEDNLVQLLSGAGLRMQRKFHLLAPISEAIVVVATKA